jgi:hypothetical protein
MRPENASGRWLEEATADGMHNVMFSTMMMKNDANVEQKAVTTSANLLSVHMSDLGGVVL